MSTAGKKKKKMAVVNAAACDGSPFCPARRSCPQGALVQGDGTGLMAKMGMQGGTARILEEKCTGCGICAKNCPMGAISMK